MIIWLGEIAMYYLFMYYLWGIISSSGLYWDIGFKSIIIALKWFYPSLISLHICINKHLLQDTNKMVLLPNNRELWMTILITYTSMCINALVRIYRTSIWTNMPTCWNHKILKFNQSERFFLTQLPNVFITCIIITNSSGNFRLDYS